MMTFANTEMSNLTPNGAAVWIVKTVKFLVLIVHAASYLFFHSVHFI